MSARVARPAALRGIVVVALCALGACGKKGPPLPPLVKLPVAPPEIMAERRGNTVDLQFVIPSVNTDGSRPANVASAEVYAITAPANTPTTYTDSQILKYGTKVATLEVKAPRDPNLTTDPDEPGDEVEAPEGAGLDQGATARVEEPLTRNLLKPVTVPPDPRAPPSASPPPIADASTGPLVGPSPVAPSRTYAAVGVSTRGKRGPLSRRVTVPLVPPPPSPSTPTMSYDENAVTLEWTPPAASSSAGDAAQQDALPSHPLLTTRADMVYMVYDVSNPDAPVRLTTSPVAEPKYSDARMTWGEKRCYTVRAAERVGGALIESDPAPPRCETLEDTFPPAEPKGLTAIASEGAINLIWEPNSEKDLAGYLVLRGATADQALTPLTPAPIGETSFRDAVPAGATYVYAVKAVDRAGNASAPSARVTETAR